jgi:hypothetical protein
VRDFYANHFLPNIPPDIELVPVSEIFAQDRIVEEYVVRFDLPPLFGPVKLRVRPSWLARGVSRS